MFNITDVVSIDDGSVELEINYDDEFVRKIKKTYGWKRLTKQRLEWFVNKCILNYIDNEGGDEVSTRLDDA